MDRYLDAARAGPLYLKQVPIAQREVDSIHSVRDDRESDRIQEYIENNPVQAGLVANAEDYPWSSAGKNSRDESRLSRLVSLRHET